MKTICFDLDGTLCSNTWGEYEKAVPYNNSIKKVNELYNNGNYIVLVTSRPESSREITVNQLENDGLKYHQLVMSLFHGTRILINDYSNTNPYPTAKAINTKRNSLDFLEKI